MSIDIALQMSRSCLPVLHHVAARRAREVRSTD
jgi:hypothetical protein